MGSTGSGVNTLSAARRRALALAALVLLAAPFAPAARAGADGNDAPGAAATFRDVTAGGTHTCAILDDGTVRCWGANNQGQLGLGDTANRGDGPDMGDQLAPVDLGPGRTATSLTSGDLHTCALLDNGTVKCWGDNSFGQLGVGDTNDRGDGPNEMGGLLPAVNLGTGRTATAIAAGWNHTCAILDNGTAKCWGANVRGQLGQGDTNNRGDGPNEMGDNLPAISFGTGIVDGVPRPVTLTATALAGGQDHTCALFQNATVKCWGDSFYGQLGINEGGARGDSGLDEMGNNLPVVDLGTGRTAAAITAGRHHTCALLTGGDIKCWGRGGDGQLGQGDSGSHGGDGHDDMGDALAPVDLGDGRTATAVAAGSRHTCALLDTGAVKCWGFNNGALGVGDTTIHGDQPGEMGDNLPTVALGTGRTATAVTAGNNHGCARLDDARLKCWGANAAGQLGLGDTSTRGDGPNEMGDSLATVDLGTGRRVGPAGAMTVGVSAQQTSVVVGATIDYQITVHNTGPLTLTGIQLAAPGTPDCARPVPNLAPGSTTHLSCSYQTVPADVPQKGVVLLASTTQGTAATSNAAVTTVAPVTFRPDGRIRLGTGTTVGDGVYNTTGAGQRRSATVGDRGTATFTLVVQNDGNVSDTITVAGLGSTGRFSVRYLDGATDVTASVGAGTFAVTGLAPGATHRLTLTIKARAGTAVGASLSRLVTATSSGGGVQDAVMATVTRR